MLCVEFYVLLFFVIRVFCVFCGLFLFLPADRLDLAQQVAELAVVHPLPKLSLARRPGEILVQRYGYASRLTTGTAMRGAVAIRSAFLSTSAM